MTAPAKTVSDDVLERVSDALNALEVDPALRRTKREIERITGLSHATVARAFAQDAQAAATGGVARWRLTERFARLTSETGRRSQQGAEESGHVQTIKEKNARIAELEAERDGYAQALYAYWLNAHEPSGGAQPVTALGANRPRRQER